MAHTVVWTLRARQELEAIHGYIATMNPPAAQRVARALVEAADSLEAYPMRGRAVRGGRQLTTVTPYVIRYQVRLDEVIILRVRHAARRRV